MQLLPLHEGEEAGGVQNMTPEHAQTQTPAAREDVSRDVDNTSLPLLQQYVQRGALLLDKKKTGWEWEVSTVELQLFSALDCVLGQLFGSYDRGFKELKLTKNKQLVEHGFMWDNIGCFDDIRKQVRTLETYWCDEIFTRRFIKDNTQETAPTEDVLVAQ